MNDSIFASFVSNSNVAFAEEVRVFPFLFQSPPKDNVVDHFKPEIHVLIDHEIVKLRPPCIAKFGTIDLEELDMRVIAAGIPGSWEQNFLDPAKWYEVRHGNKAYSRAIDLLYHLRRRGEDISLELALPTVKLGLIQGMLAVGKLKLSSEIDIPSEFVSMKLPQLSPDELNEKLKKYLDQAAA